LSAAATAPRVELRIEFEMIEEGEENEAEKIIEMGKVSIKTQILIS
jgi:hypothetical protein